MRFSSARYRRLLAPAGLLLILAVSGCATLPAPSAAGGSGENKPGAPHCPEVSGVTDPSPCVPAGAELNQQANQTLNSRVPLSAAEATRAAGLTNRIQESLQQLRPAQRLSAPAVRAALLRGGISSTDLVVLDGPPYTSVGFGGYEVLTTREAICAWGQLSAAEIAVQYGGITREGGCLPSAGGH